MSSDSRGSEGDEAETIIEYVVRERLTREQLVDLLASLGGQKQGARDELAERLLGIRGLKAKDVLQKLSTDDLKLVAKRFDVPEPSKPTTPGGFLNSMFSDEKSGLVKRIDEAASKERASVSRSAAKGTQSAPNPTEVVRPVETPARFEGTRSAAAPSAALEPPRAQAAGTPPPETHRLGSRASPMPPIVATGDQVEFEDLCHFLESVHLHEAVG